jgi:hypothetical protein
MIVPGLFSTIDEAFHSKYRRAVANSYAMSTLVQFEPLIDSTTRVFINELTQRFADRKNESGICDFGTWLQYYAFDVIGELSFSRRLGFLEQGTDVDGIISEIENQLNSFAVVGRCRLFFFNVGFTKSEI